MKFEKLSCVRLCKLRDLKIFMCDVIGRKLKKKHILDFIFQVVTAFRSENKVQGITLKSINIHLKMTGSYISAIQSENFDVGKLLDTFS